MCPTSKYMHFLIPERKQIISFPQLLIFCNIYNISSPSQLLMFRRSTCSAGSAFTQYSNGSTVNQVKYSVVLGKYKY